MKLTKAQDEIMTRAKGKIDFARAHTPTEWAQKKKGYNAESIERMIRNCGLYRQTPEGMRASIEQEIQRYADEYIEYYHEEQNGIVSITCNSKPLKKLEEYGLIEIIYDSTGTSFGLDTIKVLNY